MLKFFHFARIIVSGGPVETLFILATHKDGARRLHLVQQVLVVGQVLNDIVVNFFNPLIVFILDLVTTSDQLIHDLRIRISECNHGDFDRGIISFFAFVAEAGE